ncbi:MAG: hypothetical protein ACJAVI_002955 [Candidatus Azotimanducaceae bacterium]
MTKGTLRDAFPATIDLCNDQRSGAGLMISLSKLAAQGAIVDLKISAFDAEDDFQNAQTKIAVQTSVAVQ